MCADQPPSQRAHGKPRKLPSALPPPFRPLGSLLPLPTSVRQSAPRPYIRTEGTHIVVVAILDAPLLIFMKRPRLEIPTGMGRKGRKSGG